MKMERKYERVGFWIFEKERGVEIRYAKARNMAKKMWSNERHDVGEKASPQTKLEFSLTSDGF
jgi:hypothetical protein